MINVVAACLTDGQKFLLCQRPAGKSRANCWEFPGGKIESEETPEAAIVREIQEELGITVLPEARLTSVNWNYPDVSIHLTLFRCRMTAGTPILIEHQAMAWVSYMEALSLDLAPADRALLKQLNF